MANAIQSLNEWGAWWCGHAGVMLIQSSVLISLLIAADGLLRRRIRPTLRYGLWMLVMVKLLLPPGLALPTGIGYWVNAERTTEVVAAPAESPPGTTGQVTPQVPGNANVPSVGPRETETVAPHRDSADASSNKVSFATSENTAAGSREARLSVEALALLAWLAGVTVFTAITAVRWRRERAVMMNSRPAVGRGLEIMEALRTEMGLKAAVSLRWSSEVYAPAVCGLVRPVVLLPEGLEHRMDDLQLRRVMLHELQHVQRGDLWINFMQSLLAIAYFYHPLVWLANSRIRQVREQAVDECVVARMGGGAAEYGRMLIDMAEGMMARQSFSLGLIGILESRNRLEERIRLMLERPNPKHASLGKRGVLMIVLAGCLVLPMAGAQVARQIKMKTAQFKPAGKVVLEKADKTFREIGDLRIKAFTEGNVKAFVSTYTPEMLVLNDRAPLVSSRTAMMSEIEKSRAQLERFNGIQWHSLKYWIVGEDVYAAWQMSITFKAREIPMLVTDYQKGVSVFTRQPDGNLGLHWDCWNLDALPTGAPNLPPANPMPMGFELAAADDYTLGAESIQDVYKTIGKLEHEFHKLFVEGKELEAVDYYTEDALLLSMDEAPVEGRDAIRRYLKADPTDLLDLKLNVLAIEGEGPVVRVANQFEWSFRDSAQGGQPVTLPGKGIHVWRLEPDGWKIFLDVNNLSVPLPPTNR